MRYLPLSRHWTIPDRLLRSAFSCIIAPITFITWGCYALVGILGGRGWCFGRGLFTGTTQAVTAQTQNQKQ